MSEITTSNDTILLRLGHSPDPDDAFMFYGLAKDKFPTGPYRFEHVMQDIQTLSHRARSGDLEIHRHQHPRVPVRGRQVCPHQLRQLDG